MAVEALDTAVAAVGIKEAAVVPIGIITSKAVATGTTKAGAHGVASNRDPGVQTRVAGHPTSRTRGHGVVTIAHPWETNRTKGHGVDINNNSRVTTGIVGTLEDMEGTVTTVEVIIKGTVVGISRIIKSNVATCVGTVFISYCVLILDYL